MLQIMTDIVWGKFPGMGELPGSGLERRVVETLWSLEDAAPNGNEVISLDSGPLPSTEYGRKSTGRAKNPPLPVTWPYAQAGLMT